jgi:hypothetical protein
MFWSCFLISAPFVQRYAHRKRRAKRRDQVILEVGTVAGFSIAQAFFARPLLISRETL